MPLASTAAAAPRHRPLAAAPPPFAVAGTSAFPVAAPYHRRRRLLAARAAAPSPAGSGGAPRPSRGAAGPEPPPLPPQKRPAPQLPPFDPSEIVDAGNGEDFDDLILDESYYQEFGMTQEEAYRQQLLSQYEQDPEAMPADAADVDAALRGDAPPSALRGSGGAAAAAAANGAGAAACAGGAAAGGGGVGGERLPPGVEERLRQLEVYGPPAVVMAGFRAEEYAMARAILDSLGAESVKVLPATPELLQTPVGRAVQEPEVDWTAPRPAGWIRGGAWGSQRTILFSGLDISEQATLVELLEAEGLPNVCVTMALADNANSKLGEVLADAVKAQRKRERRKQLPHEEAELAGRLIQDTPGASDMGEPPSDAEPSSLSDRTQRLREAAGAAAAAPPPPPTQAPQRAGARPEGAAGRQAPAAQKQPPAAQQPKQQPPAPQQQQQQQAGKQKQPNASARPQPSVTPPPPTGAAAGGFGAAAMSGGAFAIDESDPGLAAWFEDDSTGPTFELPWSEDAGDQAAAAQDALSRLPPPLTNEDGGEATLDEWLAARGAAAPGDATGDVDPGDPTSVAPDLAGMLDRLAAMAQGTGGAAAGSAAAAGGEWEEVPEEGEAVAAAQKSALAQVQEALRRGADPDSVLRALSSSMKGTGAAAAAEDGVADDGSGSGGLEVVEATQTLPPPPLRSANAAAGAAAAAPGAAGAGDASGGVTPFVPRRRAQEAMGRKLSKEAAARVIDVSSRQGAAAAAGPGAAAARGASPRPAKRDAPPPTAAPAPPPTRQPPPPQQQRGPYGPAVPEPPSEDDALIAMRPEFRRALENKKVQFVDLGKVPKKYRDQLLGGRGGKRAAADAAGGAAAAAAGAGAENPQQEQPPGGAAAAGGGAGEKAAAPRGRPMSGARMPGTAAAMRAPVAAAAEKLVPRVERPKLQRVEVPQQPPPWAVEDASSPPSFESSPAGDAWGRDGQPAAAAAFDDSSRFKDANSSGGDADDAPPRRGGRVVLDESQLRDLLASAGTEGLDARRLLAEAIAIGCEIPAAAAAAAGIELPTPEEVEAVRPEAEAAFEEMARAAAQEEGGQAGDWGDDAGGVTGDDGEEGELDADEDPDAVKVELPPLQGASASATTAGGAPWGGGGFGGDAGSAPAGGGGSGASGAPRRPAGRSWGAGWTRGGGGGGGAKASR